MPKAVGLAFALCLAVALAATSWISWTALQLERTEAEAWEKAETEERVRLALWRMDSSLAPLLTQEVARSGMVYRAFYSADRAYGKTFQNIPKGEVLVPSPLLSFRPPHIRVHFQVDPDGTITSPQAPTGDMRDVAEARGHATNAEITAATEWLGKLRELVDRERLVAALPADVSGLGWTLAGDHDDTEEPSQQPVLGPQAAASRSSAGSLRKRLAAVQSNVYNSVYQADEQAWVGSRRGGPGQRVEDSQSARNSAELMQRVMNCDVGNFSGWLCPDVGGVPVLGTGMPSTTMQPLWIGGELLLARRVVLDGGDVVQGCWLDWTSLESTMLAAIEDLLPDAELQRVTDISGADGERQLAVLPVSLVPGSVPADSLEARSPVLFSLGVAWICVVLAACAIGLLLLGAMALSERRRGFVSAVTHEMRTPLTTFRLYTEMLSEGMVRDEGKRSAYLERMRTEADRLGHLVENVLAYAGLESGRTQRQVERTVAAEVVARVRDRLGDRAGQSEMELVVAVDDEAARSILELDLSAVEQILLNLVDNACKYAAGANDRRVHLDATRVAGSLRLTVRDHGPGISSAGARRLFRPFSKSVDEAARSAPGVGLGLALSRRFAREMGGDLHLDESVTDGAAFVLRLPVAAAAEGDA